MLAAPETRLAPSGKLAACAMYGARDEIDHTLITVKNAKLARRARRYRAARGRIAAASAKSDVTIHLL
jgi:hypothetical protein